MDGIASVASQQPALLNTQGGSTSVQTHEPPQEQMAEATKEGIKQARIDSLEKAEDLVKDLNAAISPLNTSLKFGVDQQDIFYVSVIDTKSSKTIRRFPAEDAAALLPKMREVSGLLFDSRG
ncbi:MAG: flagellar protein FlaG [Sulfuricurvum sp.]